MIDGLFLDLQLGLDSHVCNKVYRRGREPRGTGETGNAAPAINKPNKPQQRRATQPRPIVVGFTKLADKIKLFRNLKNLKQLQKWEKVYITDDLTECQRAQTRDLRSLAAYARSQGIEATVRNQNIWVEKRKYAYNEIHRLAPELTLEKTKTIEILEGNWLAFQSEHAPLSNFYPCNIVYKNRKFLSSEAALHHSRAIVCKRFVEAGLIEKELYAYKVKKIGGSFKPTADWDGVKDDTLEEILVEKFIQNPFCRDALLATGNKKLLEATGDLKWACGMPLAKIHTITEN